MFLHAEFFTESSLAEVCKHIEIVERPVHYIILIVFSHSLCRRDFLLSGEELMRA